MGDSIILSKPLGVGILSAALKKECLSDAGYREMIALTTQLNKPGLALSRLEGVHAMTDVTGFGLAGHLLELARGAGLRAALSWNTVPIVDEAMTLAQGDIYTGASTRNWAAYGNEVTLSNQPGIWQQHLLTDPQTSGGLLIACAPESEAEVLAILQADGFSRAAVIGRFEAGSGMAVS